MEWHLHQLLIWKVTWTVVIVGFVTRTLVLVLVVLVRACSCKNMFLLANYKLGSSNLSLKSIMPFFINEANKLADKANKFLDGV